MTKQLLPIFIFFTISIQINSQNTSSKQLVRSTTGVAGSSSTISISNKNYIIEQSIGQTSAIGTFKTNGYTLRQGFIQPNVFAKIQDKDIPLNLNVVVYPNPFAESVSISFTEQITDKINVAVFDLLGRQVFSKSYEANQKVNVHFNNLSVANYIIKVTANNKQFIRKIIKK